VNQTHPVARHLFRFAMLAGLLATGLMATPAFAQTTAPAQPVAPAQVAPAQTAPAQVPGNQVPIILGIMDSQAVANTSVAGKSLNEQVNAALNQIETDFNKNEQTLQLQMQQLVAARSGNPPMAPADFEAKRKALIAQDQKLQQTYDKNKQALGARIDKAKAKMGETLHKILADIARTRGLTLVLERSAAHLFVPQWDVTQEVMQRLNKAMPSIKL